MPPLIVFVHTQGLMQKSSAIPARDSLEIFHSFSGASDPHTCSVSACIMHGFPFTTFIFLVSNMLFFPESLYYAKACIHGLSLFTFSCWDKSIVQKKFTRICSFFSNVIMLIDIRKPQERKMLWTI